MVSRPRRATARSGDTRDRLIAAAAAEFAARGFDGAKVDRIAARARVNKAMLYYHFASKAGLYREILRGTFSGVAAAVRQVRDQADAPARQIRGVVDAVIREAAERPHFPAIWLREMAEGGRHLDDDTIDGVRQVIETLAHILAEGRRRGQFAPVHPLVTHIGIVAPILFFAASGPLRARFAHLMSPSLVLPPIHALADHVVAATLAALTPTAAAPRRRRRAQRRPHR
jgi:TetR/AcrR family transcriptional regulator